MNKAIANLKFQRSIAAKDLKESIKRLEAQTDLVAKYTDRVDEMTRAIQCLSKCAE